MEKKKKAKMGRPKKMGRPTKRSLGLIRRILALAKEGKFDREIAEECGISLATLKNWKGEHKDFLAAFKASKNVANELVEQALFHRALGYSHPDVKIFATETGVHAEEFIKHYPPDTAAAQFYLKNRSPKKWRDKTEHDVKLGLEQLILQSAKKETDGEDND